MPVFFSIIITLVLLFVFDNDVKDTILQTANRIPVVNQWIPDPSLDTDNEEEELLIEKIKAENESLNQQILELQQQLEQKDSDLQTTEQTVQELQQELTAINEQLDEQTQSQEEYLEKIRELSSMYGNMTPSKAASIMENLTLNERVLLLNEMSSSKRGAILEKMDPSTAAEASILLKDLIPVEDQQIAALQERIQLLVQQENSNDDGLRLEDLAELFSSMDAELAAGVLVEMYGQQKQQVIEIVRVMDAPSRSNILSSIAGESEAQAAEIISSLGDE